MTGVHATRCQSQSISSQTPYWRNRTMSQWSKEASSLLLSLVMWPAIVLITSLCSVSPGQAQTPEAVFGTALYTSLNPICPRLNDPSQTPPSAFLSGTEDLRQRCNELAPTPQDPFASRLPALRQVAPEEVDTLRANAVETSTRTIRARLAALRRGASAINVQGLGFNIQEPALPGTLVAALGPFAAASSATPTTNTTTNTPSLFNKLGLFVNGLFSVGDKDPTSNEEGFTFHTYGVITGVDYRFTPKLVLGVGFTYESTNNDLDSTISLLNNSPASVNGGSADTRSFGVSFYGTYYVLEQFYVDGMLGFGWNHYQLDRVIRYGLGGGTSSIDQIAHAEPDGHQFSFSLGAGYDFKQGAWTFGPLARLHYSKLKIDGFQEKFNTTQPGFGWALALDSQDVESLTTVLGGRASYALSTGLGVLLPQVRIEWEHEFKNDARLITAQFINDPRRQPIRFTADNPDRNYVNIGVALSATFRGGIAAFIDYTTVVGLANVSRHDITLGIRGEL